MKKNLSAANPARPHLAGSQPAQHEVAALLALLTQGDYPAASKRAANMTQQYPAFGLGWKILAVALKNQGRNADALEPMQKAAELLPGDVDALGNLGGCLTDLGRLDEAEAVLRRALAFDRGSFNAQFNLGLALEKMGRVADAAACYRNAIQAKPDSAEAYGNLGALLHGMGNLAEAEECYRAALRFNPAFADVHGYLARVLHAQGKLDEALTHFMQRAKLAPGNVDDQHFIAALTGANTERPPQKYVEGIFDNYANNFDSHLQQTLRYDVPAKLAALLARQATAAGQWEVLDLGCGTGLAGVALAPFAKQLVGVDLSARMLEQARERNLYQRLEQADLVSMMQAEPATSYDLIVAADVFVYLGKLDEVIAAGKRLLRPGGFFAFSVEDCEATPATRASDYQLKPTGRYGQSMDYLNRLAAEQGFRVAATEATPIRTERNLPIAGHIFLWSAPGAGAGAVPAPSIVQLLQQAIAQHQAGNIVEAERLYREILGTQPTHPEANHNLGVIAVQSGHPADGLVHFVVALEADPARGQYWLSYIDALHQAGQTGTAREVLAMARQYGLGGDDVDALEASLTEAVRPAVSVEPVVEDIVVIDSVFPMKVPYSFRNAEVNGLFKLLPALKSYTMFPMLPGERAWFRHGYGIDERAYLDNKAGYLQHHPENEGRVEYLHPNREYRFKLAYMVFLAETYTALPFLERHGIPFVFELYPGGAFGLDNPGSDAMLRAVFGSKCFRKVITTQKVTYDYLLSRKLCAKENIVHLFGGILQFPKDEQHTKQYYRKDKGTFDICFVAAKYTPRGLDKGYDLFIEAARHLARKYADMRFHVIGGFDENEIDVSDIRDSITFYGFRQPDWLKEFYPRMDICLSPNRPFQKYTGDFDGYPMGCEQSLFGVAMFTTDPLGNNDGLYGKDEIVLFKPELEDITRNVEYYFNNLDALYDLAEKGRLKTGKLFDIDERLRKIADVLRSAADAA